MNLHDLNHVNLCIDSVIVIWNNDNSVFSIVNLS